MNELKIGNLKPAPAPSAGEIRPAPKGAFNQILKDAVATVDGMEKAADNSIVDLLNGQANVHETMIALQKADISMRLLLNVRNKALEAYKEIIHMQF